MSVATMIIGESGTGKSTALRNLNPAETLLIQSVRKPLPFKSKDWKVYDKERCPEGRVFVTDNSAKIIEIMRRATHKVIVLDDFQYILANEFMRRSDEKNYDKFTDIGRHAWDILSTASQLADDVRVYILSHTQSDEQGRVRVKTIGKMLDDKITVEGMFSIVLRTQVVNGNYLFSTRNNGSDTVKSPMGLFADELIPNDLAAVDAAICDYYELTQPA
jgi:hypothetical protein